MPGPLLFIAADARECTALISHWENLRTPALSVNWAREGLWKRRPVMAVANGAGADRAFAAVILSCGMLAGKHLASKSSAVCNIGFCGALDDALRIGDIFVATEVRNGTRAYAVQAPTGPAAPSGVVMSLDHVAQTALEKRGLRSTGASVVEMEAAGAARASEDMGLPFYCVRVVSDLAGEDFANDFNAALGPDGRFSAVRLAAGALVRPRERFGELMRLKQRTVLASRKLGDFLAGCTF
jgi:adenosylhomocysteine nucleosidase